MGNLRSFGNKIYELCVLLQTQWEYRDCNIQCCNLLFCFCLIAIVLLCASLSLGFVEFDKFPCYTVNILCPFLNSLSFSDVYSLCTQCMVNLTNVFNLLKTGSRWNQHGCSSVKLNSDWTLQAQLDQRQMENNLHHHPGQILNMTQVGCHYYIPAYQSYVKSTNVAQDKQNCWN